MPGQTSHTHGFPGVYGITVRLQAVSFQPPGDSSIVRVMFCSEKVKDPSFPLLVIAPPAQNSFV